LFPSRSIRDAARSTNSRAASSSTLVECSTRHVWRSGRDQNEAVAAADRGLGISDPMTIATAHSRVAGPRSTTIPLGGVVRAHNDMHTSQKSLAVWVFGKLQVH
jgi:hypothetical protein